MKRETGNEQRAKFSFHCSVSSFLFRNILFTFLVCTNLFLGARSRTQEKTTQTRMLSRSRRVATAGNPLSSALIAPSMAKKANQRRTTTLKITPSLTHPLTRFCGAAMLRLRRSAKLFLVVSFRAASLRQRGVSRVLQRFLRWRSRRPSSLALLFLRVHSFGAARCGRQALRLRTSSPRRCRRTMACGAA